MRDVLMQRSFSPVGSYFASVSAAALFTRSVLSPPVAQDAASAAAPISSMVRMSVSFFPMLKRAQPRAA